MFLMTMSFMLSFSFLFLNHPMTLGMTLLLQTLIISMITGMLNMNFWFSYILFLIMVGGLLVLFIYMTSIASNEMFNYSNKILWMILLLIILTMMSYLIFDNLLINSVFMHKDNIFLLKNMSLMKFFNYPSVYMMFFMINYLFITLIAAVKITKIEFGPLRQKF